jgi:hypothetical protein
VLVSAQDVDLFITAILNVRGQIGKQDINLSAIEIHPFQMILLLGV